MSSIEQVEQILSKYNIPFKYEKYQGQLEYAGYVLWNLIKKLNDPLTEQEHLVLFDFFWKNGFSALRNISISNGLKLKLIRNRDKIGYEKVMLGLIGGSAIIQITSACHLNVEEETELWRVFHKLSPTDSSRDSDRINALLDNLLYKLVEHKIKWFGKINVLDIGCGKNGNGISTLAARYNGKIRGFGIDLDIQEHPSNVDLARASVERIPFRDNFFDVIYACNVIYYFNNNRIAGILREILRVLKPKGYFIFDDSTTPVLADRLRHPQKYRDEIIPMTMINARILHRADPMVIVKY